MQNVIIISLGNEIDRYAELLKEEFGIIRMPADSALTKDLSSARFILYSFRAIQYRLDNRIKTELELPVIAIVSESDVYDHDDPIGKLLFYGISEPIAEPIPDKLFLLRIRHALKRYSSTYQARLNYSYKMYKMEKFISRMEYWISSCKNETFEILCIDIERIKVLNEIYGYEKVDDLLCYLEQRIINLIGSKQAVTGRYNADILIFINSSESEFLFSLPHLLESWTEEYKFPDKINFNIGMCAADNPAMPAMKIIDRAKLAANTVKEDSSSSIAFYGKNIYSRILEEQIYSSEIERAIENREFILYAQPQTDMISGKTVGAEILIRWKHPKRGLLYPADFIPTMERTGYIRRIDLYVFEETCRFMRSIMDKGIAPPPFSVNFSGISFYYDDLCRKVCEITDKYRIPKRLIQLEITESTYVDGIKNFRSTFQDLKSSGFTIIMDDFGSGYSSLNSLRSYDIDIIKLDINFLKNWDTEASGSRSKIIVESILQMTGKLDLAVIVEGVETKEQSNFLINICCRYVQGFYYFKPMPAEELALKIDEGSISVDTNGIRKHDPSFSVIRKDLFHENRFAAAAAELDGSTIAMRFCNPAFTSLTGIDLNKPETTSCDFLDFITEESKSAVLDAGKAVMEGRLNIVNISVTLAHNGEPYKNVVLYIFSLKRNGGDNMLAFIADSYTENTDLLLSSIANILGQTIDVITEITIPSFTYRQLTLSKKNYFDVESCGEYAPAYMHMINDEIEPGDIPSVSAVFSPDNLQKFIDDPETSDTVSVKYRLKNAPETTWMESSAVFIRNSVPQKIIVLAKDVTANVEFKKVSELAKHDYLTHTMNRSAIPKIESLLRSEKYSDADHAVCMIDVDNFKIVNNTYGHYEGDKCLKTISGIIKSRCSGKDSIVRFGGDEFLVYLAAVPSEQYALEWANSVIDDIKHIDGNENGLVSISVGIAFSKPPHDLFGNVYREADKALYKAKRNRKGRAAVYGVK